MSIKERIREIAVDHIEYAIDEALEEAVKEYLSWADLGEKISQNTKFVIMTEEVINELIKEAFDE